MRWIKGEGWVDRICVICDTPFKVKRWNTKKWPCLYCSTRCMGTAQRESRRSSFAPHEDLRRLYIDEGRTLQQIGTHYGVTLQAVAWQLNRAGIARRPSPTNPTWLHTPENRARSLAAHVHGTGNPLFRDIPIDEIVALYAQGMSATAIAGYYDVCGSTILHRLASAGIARKSAGFARFQIAKDGHRVQSSLELRIDNWLSDHGISHEIHPTIPLTKQQRADFLITPYYIEVWGITGNETYARRRDAKRQHYQTHGIPLIEIWPEDIVRGDLSGLSVLLDNRPA